MTSADSSLPLVSTGFAFSLPPQQSGASTDSGSGSFSFANTSGFSFKPQQPAATDNKGEYYFILILSLFRSIWGGSKITTEKEVIDKDLRSPHLNKEEAITLVNSVYA